MNNQPIDTQQTHRETSSHQLYRRYFFPQPVTIIYTRTLRDSCIVFGEVAGDPQVIQFDFSTPNLVRIQPRSEHIQPREIEFEE